MGLGGTGGLSSRTGTGLMGKDTGAGRGDFAFGSRGGTNDLNHTSSIIGSFDAMGFGAGGVGQGTKKGKASEMSLFGPSDRGGPGGKGMMEGANFLSSAISGEPKKRPR